MSRSIIGGIVAIVIAALTATAYLVTTSRLTGDIRKDTEDRVARARNLLARTTQLEGLSLRRKAEVLANDPGLLNALDAGSSDDRTRDSNLAFSRFRAEQSDAAVDQRVVLPDILALVDKKGDIVAMDGVSNPVASQWKKDGQEKGEILFPGLALALQKKLIISEIWHYPGKGLMRVGVATIIDPDAPIAEGSEGAPIKGAVVAAYALTSDDARKQEGLLGADVAYVDGGTVFATSFRRDGKNEEDTDMQAQLRAELSKAGLDKPDGIKKISLGGRDYLAAALHLARFPSEPLPDTYPPATAGALVLMAPSEQAERVGIVKTFVLILGLGALAMALFGMYVSNHRILNQVDQIELGVADVINGNLDRTFRPVGDELEGLANGLNVMLARLLGRPEPGEEEFDEDGNPIVPGRVEFEEAEEGARPAADPDLAALAEEPEPDYYKRVFTEYVEGRRQTGHPDEVSFENFIAKLRVNEGKLKAQYNCKAVRFRVVVKDGKVSLKPVPIFG